MKDSMIYSLIGFTIAIIPYLILICLVHDSIFDSIMSSCGLITALINAYYFKKKLVKKNA